MDQIKTLKKQKSIGKITKKEKKISPSINYDSFLDSKLKDLNFASGYLQACLEEGEIAFYQGIRNVVKANAGMKALAERTSLNRESLYGMLSENGNPLFSSIKVVLESLGIGLVFKAR